MKRVVPTEDFLIRPWKPRSGRRRAEEKKQLKETKVSPQGLLDTVFKSSCDVISDLIISCWQEPLCFLDFPGINVCFRSEVCEWRKKTCRMNVSVTCWGEFGCCGCGKVSPGTLRTALCFIHLPENTFVLNSPIADCVQILFNSIWFQMPFFINSNFCQKLILK